MGVNLFTPLPILDLDEMQGLTSEFKTHANSMVEIHNKITQKVCEEVPVQKRFFFFTCMVEIPMSAEFLETNDIDSNIITPEYVKNSIDIAITDETPFSLGKYSGYCSEVTGP